MGYLVITLDSNCLVSEMCGLFGNYTLQQLFGE